MSNTPAKKLTFVELLDQYIELRTQIRESTCSGSKPAPRNEMEFYTNRFNEVRDELEVRTSNV